MVSRRRVALAVAMAALSGGCSEDPTPIDAFTIKFQLDTEGDAATCRPGVGVPAPLSCSSYGLGCNARMAIRALDPRPPDGGNPNIRGDRAYCIPFEWTDGVEDICALGTQELLLPVVLTGIEPEPGQIEVTIWPDSPYVENCPMIPFDLVGRPIPQEGDLAVFNPAFGRRVVFDFGGQDPVVEVPLACSEPQALNEPSCAPPIRYDFEIHARDITDLVNVEEQTADSLLVRAGQPTLIDPAVSLSDFHIIPAQTVELGLVDGPSPYWREDQVPLDPAWDFAIDEGKDICAIFTVGFSDPRATCTTITAEQAALNEPVSIDAFMVDMDTWDSKIKPAIGLNAVPSDGLVLGRVVKKTDMAPIEGAVVTTTGKLPPVIQYLNDDLTDWRDDLGAPLTATSSSGYFVAQGADFRTTWDATAPGNYRAVGEPTAGQLNNKTITIFVIEMALDFGS